MSILSSFYVFDYFLRFIIVGLFFFFNDTATTGIYTLSLHDALPIFVDPQAWLADVRARTPSTPSTSSTRCCHGTGRRHGSSSPEQHNQGRLPGGARRCVPSHASHACSITIPTARSRYISGCAKRDIAAASLSCAITSVAS